MSKQRNRWFITIGFIGFFLILVLTSWQDAGSLANAPRQQPQPVAAPVAITAPAKATPAPAANNTQQVIQPVAQPVPTPPGAAEKVMPSSGLALLPMLLLGLLTGGTVVLFVGFVIRLSWQRGNGRSPYPSILAEGGHA